MMTACRFACCSASPPAPDCGFGHLVRCRSLARALGVDARVSIRGSAATRAAAALAGWRRLCPDRATVSSRGSIRSCSSSTIPHAQAAGLWVRRARRLGIRVATIHDLGLGYVASDLGIDGSVEPRLSMHGGYGDLRGPAHAILDPAVAALRERRVDATPNQILIALGGGSHVFMFAERLCRALAAAVPGADACRGGFAAAAAVVPLRARRMVARPRRTRRGAGGGVGRRRRRRRDPLRSVCASAVPAVAVAVTAAQHPTIRAFAATALRSTAACGDRRVSTAELVAAEVAGCWFAAARHAAGWRSPGSGSSTAVAHSASATRSGSCATSHHQERADAA